MRWLYGSPRARRAEVSGARLCATALWVFVVTLICVSWMQCLQVQAASVSSSHSSSSGNTSTLSASSHSSAATHASASTHSSAASHASASTHSSAASHASASTHSSAASHASASTRSSASSHSSAATHSSASSHTSHQSSSFVKHRSSSSASPRSSSSSSSSSSPAAAETGGLKWTVLVDLTKTKETAEAFTQSLKTFVAKSTSTDVQRLFASNPTVLNSDGNLLTALSLISGVISNPATFPDVLFLAETADVSTSVVDVLRKNDTTSNILVVSAHTSNVRLCDPTTNPRTMCMVPRDMINVRGLLDVVSSQLEWYSMAMVFANNGYGQGVQSTVTSQVQDAASTPTIVAEVFMNPGTTDAENDAIVTELMEHKPKGIACFLSETSMRGLQAAFERAGLNGTVFLIGSYEAVNILDNLTGSLGSNSTAWGALFAPYYTTASALHSAGYTESTDSMDDYGAFVLSYLFDGMRMIGEANSTTSMSALRGVRFSGFSGTVAFDSIYYQRVEATYSLIMSAYPVTNALLTWYVQSYSTKSVTTNLEPAALKQLVPASPLRSVKVCMTSAAGCADAEMLSAMLFVLLQYNANTSSSSDVASFLPVAVNTGESGVAGLSGLISVARTCTIISGPGLGSVNIALTPVINEYRISQIDYNTPNDIFTEDSYTYPYFSRTVPSNSFTYAAYADVCVHFAWERVVIVAPEDQLGTSSADAMSTAMNNRNIYVEATYLLTEVNESSIADTLKTIYKKDVSRIIVFLLPLTTDNSAYFFNLIDSLTFMHKYVFLLSKDLCLFGAANPAYRSKLVSSICFFPSVDSTRLALLNQQMASETEIMQSVKTILSDGRFLTQAETCAISSAYDFSGFAVDAAYVMIDVVERALRDNVAFNSSANLRPYIRSTSINGFTTPFTINSVGNRNYATFYADIQTPSDGVVKVGLWDEKKSPTFTKLYTSAFMWTTNSTSVPADTFRDYSFVIGSSVSTSPGTIVLSVLGFVCTIAAFFFCYRHYRMQKLIELTLESNDVPITAEELQRLRGTVDEI